MYLVHQLISIIQLMESFRVWPKVILLSGIYHTVLILRGRCSASATVCGNLRIPTLKASENVETQLKQNNFFLTWSIFCCCMYHKRFCVTVRNAGSKCNNEREDKKQWLDSNGFAFWRNYVDHANIFLRLTDLFDEDDDLLLSCETNAIRFLDFNRHSNLIYLPLH